MWLASRVWSACAQLAGLGRALQQGQAAKRAQEAAAAAASPR